MKLRLFSGLAALALAAALCLAAAGLLRLFGPRA